MSLQLTKEQQQQQQKQYREKSTAYLMS